MEPPDEKPWLPFNSKEDFEFAEIIHKAGMNQSQANALIKLIHHCQKNPSSFTLEGCDGVGGTWGTASKLTPGCLSLSYGSSLTVMRSSSAMMGLNASMKHGQDHCGDGSWTIWWTRKLYLNSNGIHKGSSGMMEKGLHWTMDWRSILGGPGISN